MQVPLLATLTFTAFCPYCRQAGRVRFTAAEGESDGSELVVCPGCRQSFDAFSWIPAAEKLAGRRLPRPRVQGFGPNG